MFEFRTTKGLSLFLIFCIPDYQSTCFRFVAMFEFWTTKELSFFYVCLNSGLPRDFFSIFLSMFEFRTTKGLVLSIFLSMFEFRTIKGLCLVT